jgi:hypothetical protein
MERWTTSARCFIYVSEWDGGCDRGSEMNFTGRGEFCPTHCLICRAPKHYLRRFSDDVRTPPEAKPFPNARNVSSQLPRYARIDYVLVPKWMVGISVIGGHLVPIAK